MNDLETFLSKVPFFKDNKKITKDIEVSNNESLAFLLSNDFLNSPRTMVVVKENLYEAQELYNLLSFSLKDKCTLFCVDEITKFTSIATSPELEASRLYVLAKSIINEPMVIITHTMALQRLLPAKSLFLKKIINLKTDADISRGEFIKSLITMGYKNVLQVVQPFEMSSRGGVVDVYTIQYDKPLRIEFFDDKIESIRLFDVTTQRTVKVIDECLIMPASEFLIDDLNKGISNIQSSLNRQLKYNESNLELEENINDDINKILNYQFEESLYRYYSYFNCYGSLVDYFKDATFFICNREAILNNAEFTLNETTENVLEMFNSGKTLSDSILLFSIEEVLVNIKNEIEVTINSNGSINDELDATPIDNFGGNYVLLCEILNDWLNRNYIVYIGLEKEVQYDAIYNLLKEKSYDVILYNDDSKFKPGKIYLSHFDLHNGIEVKNYNFVILGENEIYKKHYQINSQFSNFKDSVTVDVSDLKPGDYVVDERYGIGIYQGIETRETNGTHTNWLVIEYQNNETLEIRLEYFSRIRKYVGPEGHEPKLDSIRKHTWTKKMSKATDNARAKAKELVKLYALRSQKPGFACIKDNELIEEFEKDFGYELTVDQQKAVDDIKKDLETPIIMDRLLCGDVGFGKTEVAFRAAYKMILSGKQVALLCPTTLLARQHYLTAVDRFKKQGIRIALLSRIVSGKKQKEVLDDLKDNKIDLIIGTHRLLSDDVKFADLGLLIVDEEHKFGVTHKEKITSLKYVVDVLTLSATPIPRTLQMGLTSVKKISIINTPIANRLPVQTYVLEQNDIVIKEIIERELARNGQVFYLHNRIDQLPAVLRKINALVPKARVAIIHGRINNQTDSELNEQTMLAFINGEIDILLCTTVIENGIDIPNVNTLIVENANCFGLAQLYQLRGRVGRSDRLAYAYFFYNKEIKLSEKARKRLDAIKEFTSLGSGYKIAMRDLLARGAGDLLGEEQSGFIVSIGMDMYIELLQEAIDEELNGPKDKKETKQKKSMVGVDAYVPPEFFNNEYEIIELYRKLNKVDKVKDLKDLRDEIIDKTGKLPDSIRLLFDEKLIDIIEDDGLIETTDENSKMFKLYLSRDFEYKMDGCGVDLYNLAYSISNTITLHYVPNKNIVVFFKKDDPNWANYVTEFAKGLLKIRKKYLGE